MSDDSISKKFLSQMKKIGVDGLESLLLYLPSKYLDYRKPKPGIMGSYCTGEKVYLKLKVTRKPVIEIVPGKPARVRLCFTDGKVHAKGMSFGGDYAWKDVKEGDFVHIVCTVGEFQGKPQLQQIERIPENYKGRIVPKYKGKEKVVNHLTIAEKIAVALREHSGITIDHLTSMIGCSESMILKNAAPGFGSLEELFISIHRPRSYEDITRANNAVRMINAYYALRSSMRKGDEKEIERSRIQYGVEDIRSLVKNLPFTLTDDQRRAIWDITKDLSKPVPMDRLLSGDVGCGKTLSYAIPAVCAHLAGAKVGIIMPNTLLACQVANEIAEMFPQAKTQLMLGGADRHEGPLDGNPIVIGTTAIIWWVKNAEQGHKFDLLVIDEQQKLGVDQKNSLTSEHTNVLEATATAIPRTAAAVLYGNKKVSRIEQCPVNKSIEPRIVGSDEKREVFEELKNITQTGQVAVLYPIRKHDTGTYQVFVPADLELSVPTIVKDVLSIVKENGGEASKAEIALDDDGARIGVFIKYKNKRSGHKKAVASLMQHENSGLLAIEETDDQEEMEKCKRSVESAAKHWEKHFPGQVVMIHGGLSNKQKLEAIDRAKSGSCKVIVTSSVIEIGLTMPDLRGLLILEANNYGASTLHQFRGRIARKGGKGLFLMGVSCPVPQLDEISRARLELLIRHQNGSKIAEEDMKLRGFGDMSLNSVKQAGFLEGIFKGLKMTPEDVESLLDHTLIENSYQPSSANA